MISQKITDHGKNLNSDEVYFDIFRHVIAMLSLG
jgi:hypothetical protein